MLGGHGLTLHVGKPKAWSQDASQDLPPSLVSCRQHTLRLLGAEVRFLDRHEDREEFGAPVRGEVDGEAVVQAAQRLNGRLRELLKAGLSCKTAYTILHTYA